MISGVVNFPVKILGELLVLLQFMGKVVESMEEIQMDVAKVSYNKDGNFRSCSTGRAGRVMGNGSFERSWTPHERFMLAFLNIALPALPGSKIALPPL